MRIEDYSMIGDMQSAALVGRDGSIDWLCLPRFDSPSCFSALLGGERHGHWWIGPTGRRPADRRRYRPDTLILESEWDTPTGTVRIIDFMPPRDKNPDVVRIVEGVSGEVEVSAQVRVRFDYGRIVPWVRRSDGHLQAIGGPDSVWLHAPVPLKGGDYAHRCTFTVREGQRLPFVFTWHPSHEPMPPQISAEGQLAETEAMWAEWVARCTYQGPHRDAVVRSLITLKALTYAPTGGIVAAPTTSLPEDLGGVRNWDYRFCWLRDATLTLEALISSGYIEEAGEWRSWLLRAIAGRPQDLQIMYGVAGERRLPELELSWLDGYEDSRPVRIGNNAVNQLQLDVYGEVMNCLFIARKMGLGADDRAWAIQRELLAYVEEHWDEPDEGLWEVRGPRRHFTHSKIMCWVALDRAVRYVEEFGRTGPVDHWKRLRASIHDEICDKGFDPVRNTFTQSYGSAELDAALLLIPLVGFLPVDDPRVAGTVAAIEKELLSDGFVLRYPVATDNDVDGLAGAEGAFLACSFWLVEVMALQGRMEEADELFGRLLELRNDLGLLAEEYDPRYARLVGNFPQAFSHVPLVHAARALSRPRPTP
ncbi:glycoside hydrolase family 15 protein [Nonomuraea sp. NPDC050790]|uniref:glycoside hydrolase family 15 protein n=1 Tax=Nonomuraea sp. NPDC050790 TaxID=3364371 RepID=UPI0037A0B8DD